MDPVLSEAIARLEKLYGAQWYSLDGRRRAQAIYEEMKRIDAAGGAGQEGSEESREPEEDMPSRDV